MLNTARKTLMVIAFFRLPTIQGAALVWDIDNKMEEQRRSQRHQNIHGWPGGCHPDHVAARAAKVLEGDGHRLRISKKERRARQQQEGRKQDRSKRIDVFQRVERNPTLSESGVVAKEMGHVAMRRLMQRYRKEDRDNPCGGGVDVEGWQGDCISLVLCGSPPIYHDSLARKPARLLHPENRP